MESSSLRIYASEVLGIKSYLCPEKIYTLRSLRGGLPCRVLAVVFKTLPPSQISRLKKIMNSINVLEYSLLEIKDDSVLKELLSGREKWADFIIFFGGPDLVQKRLLTERGGQLFLPDQHSSLQQLTQNTEAEQNLSKENSLKNKDRSDFPAKKTEGKNLKEETKNSFENKSRSDFPNQKLHTKNLQRQKFNKQKSCESLKTPHYGEETNREQPVSFLQVCALEELDGGSTEVRSKKQQLWNQLKQWKKLSGI